MTLEGLRVLVVEDNPTNRLIAVRILEALGASVDVAGDGIECLSAARLHPYDVVLMDIQMPRMGGEEAARRLRALEGPVSSVPIIALTANVLPHQRERYLALGMDGVIAKPLSPAALVAEVIRVAGGGRPALAASSPPPADPSPSAASCLATKVPTG